MAQFSWDCCADQDPACLYADWQSCWADIPATELTSKEMKKTEKQVYASKLSSIKHSAKSEVFCLEEPQGTRSKWQEQVHLPYS